ncbi:energy transducer TonB [Yeosuana marina]|uniref:energy transducer TonB n=1 Tax=Yeosuana marina TaxID=1565536 RepID=UPI0014237955|nr:energy transducer TonB [Yeosuana marina]
MKKSVIILVAFVTSLLNAKTNHEQAMQKAFEFLGNNSPIENPNMFEHIANSEPENGIFTYYPTQIHSLNSFGKKGEEIGIASAETTQGHTISDAVYIENVEEYVEIPISIIEDVPVFSGCENVSKDHRRDCFQESIEAHIAKNFIYPEVALDFGIQGKVYVIFTIDSNGYVTNIRSRGTSKILKKEAERIISLLPKMTPGKQRGKPVKVGYSVPIVFEYKTS